MAIRPAIRLSGRPRMADFAEWGCAIAEALGHSQNEFLDAYSDNTNSRNEEALISSAAGGCSVEIEREALSPRSSPLV